MFTHYETHPTVHLFATARIYEQSNQDFVTFTFTIWAAGAVMQFESDKEQVIVTKETDKRCKIKVNRITLSVKCRFL